MCIENVVCFVYLIDIEITTDFQEEKKMKRLHVALVGLRFGESFIDIYRDHPFVESVALYDVNTEKAKKLTERHGLRRYCSSFEELLADDQLDAVHIISPIPCHAEQTIAVRQLISVQRELLHTNQQCTMESPLKYRRIYFGEKIKQLYVEEKAVVKNGCFSFYKYNRNSMHKKTELYM